MVWLTRSRPLREHLGLPLEITTPALRQVLVR